MNFKEEGEENKLSSKWIEVDMSWLRYKDLDLLEGIFKFWKSEGRDAMNVKLSFGVRLKQIAQGRDNLAGLADLGGFQLLDLIITEVKSHMTCYNSMPLIR